MAEIMPDGGAFSHICLQLAVLALLYLKDAIAFLRPGHIYHAPHNGIENPAQQEQKDEHHRRDSQE